MLLASLVVASCGGRNVDTEPRGSAQTLTTESGTSSSDGDLGQESLLPLVCDQEKLVEGVVEGLTSYQIDGFSVRPTPQQCTIEVRSLSLTPSAKAWLNSLGYVTVVAQAPPPLDLP